MDGAIRGNERNIFFTESLQTTFQGEIIRNKCPPQFHGDNSFFFLTYQSKLKLLKRFINSPKSCRLILLNQIDSTASAPLHPPCLVLMKAPGVELCPLLGGSVSRGRAADNQPTSIIAVVRGANENKCEPLHRANTANGRETAWTGLHSRCKVLIRCLTCSYATLQLLISCAPLEWMKSVSLI